MKFLLLLFALFVFTTAGSAQSDRTRIDFQIKQIGIDSSHDDVVKALGEPTKVVELGEDECTDGVGRSLEYDGLVLKTDTDKSDKTKSSVVSAQITSKKWKLGSGIRLGDSKEKVRKRLGKEFTGESSSPDELVYDVLEKYGPGAVTFYFEKDRLVKIELKMTVC